ncbi:RAMP superfamily CRISPR-associated protein [Salinarimonas chemoclinalis]|uniref:RAMP superfamily CRISPR-associated protein n=1 Tax=Salinarimonas chemoclinalis TaxID=3241599 RepID=UPI003558A91C
MSAPASARVSVALHSYWHCGTGRGASAMLDAVIARDALGLPVLPGRSLRGLLREAVETLAEIGAEVGGRPLPADAASILFGTSGFETVPGAARPRANRGTVPGRLAVSDARLEPAALAHLAHLDAEERAVLARTLVTTLAATAIDDHGSAKAATLRTVEAAVPVGLEARIDLLPPPPGASAAALALAERWLDVLVAAAPFVRAVGGGRTRGLGRCTLALSEAA